MRTRIRLLALLLAVIVICVAPVHAAESPAREHPYLFFTKQDIPRLKARLEQPTIAAVWQSVQAAALRAPGPRGGGPDVLCAGIAYQLTGESRYAEAGVGALMAGVTSTQPWIVPTPEIKYCSLDMASRTLPIAYGYDLLYDAMTEDQRAQCREALSKNVFAPFLKVHAVHDREKRLFTDPDGWWEWWTTGYFNWNSWINGGIGTAGLAMMDEAPEARQVVEMARESLKYMQFEFNQGDVEDGGWDEGLIYWQMAMMHAVGFYAALEHVQGTDDGFFELPGVRNALEFATDFTAPDGCWVNFSDCSGRQIPIADSEFYFLAARYGNPQFVRLMDSHQTPRNTMAFTILWRPAIVAPEAAPRPPVRLYRDVQWAVLRSDALYLPFKGGDMAANHGNYDANSMLLWVKGERMLNDPGYGRVATADHNSLLVNGKGQSLNEPPFPWGTRPRSFGRHSNSVAEILRCGTIGHDSYLVCEAKTCYAGMLERYQRHVVLAEGGYVVIFDDVQAAQPSEFTVNWHTTAGAAAEGERQALFTGRQERLHVTAAADRPAAAAVVQAQYDKAFRIDSNGASKTWRLFTVLAPGEAPAVTADFTPSNASVNVTGRKFSFERNDDGSYRYAGGELTPAR